eukprot:scpid44917/ scgid32387/ 
MEYSFDEPCVAAAARRMCRKSRRRKLYCESALRVVTSPSPLLWAYFEFGVMECQQIGQVVEALHWLSSVKIWRTLNKNDFCKLGLNFPVGGTDLNQNCFQPHFSYSVTCTCPAAPQQQQPIQPHRDSSYTLTAAATHQTILHV